MPPMEEMGMELQQEVGVWAAVSRIELELKLELELVVALNIPYPRPQKGPVQIPNRKEAGPDPQPERGHSSSPTGKGLVHIPNWKGASPYPQLERGHAKSVD